jgi:DNA repair exonuclease SbcCD nuclease subunit
MRFIHTGDIHLGATPESKKEWAKSRGDEIWQTFEKLIKKIKEDPVEILIIAGDLFHRQPLLRELKEVDYLFSTIPDTKVVLCAGNHDAIKKGSFYDGFQWSENVVFLGDRNIQKVEITELNVCVYGLSYHQTEITDALYDHIIVDRPDMINILVAHGGDEKHIPINRKKVSMSGFDYVAMGHIHKPFMDEKYKMAYCGSLEPIDVNDMGERGYIYGEVDKKDLELEFVPFSKRQYMDLDFTVTPTATNMEIRHRLSDIFKERGLDNMYRITFNGYRDPEFNIYLEEIKDCGNIVSIIDETIPDFDFEELYQDNKDNILGMFIGRYLDRETLDARSQKELYYGTKALLQAMEDKL